MSLKNKETIFQSPSQRIDHISAENIRLLSDRALIRDLGVPTESSGGIIIPETAQESRAQQEWGNLRIGLVLAVGPGDRFYEHGITDEDQVIRSQITTTCETCEGKKFVHFDMQAYDLKPGGEGVCPDCHGEGKVPVCVPPQCKPGDRVLYSRRREAEFVVNGESLSMVHSEQSVVAVLED